MFAENDANSILQIPLAKSSIRDKIIWNSSTSGDMDAKAAYVVARSLVGKEVPDRNTRKPLWKLLWSAKVIPRIKLFFWRTIQGILPTGLNLQRKHLAVDGVCCVCGYHGESASHIFLHCSLSRQVWQGTWPVMVDWQLEEEYEFWEKALELWKETDKLEEGLILCWMIWNNRNTCFHEGVCKTPWSIISAAFRMKEEYQEANVQQHSGSSYRDRTWRPPPVNVVKVNVDASFIAVTRRATLGVVLRNATSQVEASALSVVENVESPLQAELNAIHYGLKVANDLSFTRIILESDCQMAVSEISKRERSFSEWYSIVRDISDLSEKFLSSEFLHVKREGNLLADAVAKSRTVINGHCIWISELPSDVCNLDVIL